jgi:hypothetical protein
MTRLRRRSVASVWLCGLLMLVKFAFATVCSADGLAMTPATDTAVATVSASANDASDDAGNCLHAGKAGCHCACAHSAALPALDDVQADAPVAIARIPMDAVPLRLTRLQTDLRPPIA